MPREATARKQQAGPRLGRYAMIDVGKLKPYPRNARTHSQAQIGQIARSIQEFGFTNPLLVDGSNEIIAGHGRLDAAKAAGMASVPCIVLEGLTPAQKRALVIADNQLALNAGWDLELLSGEIQALRELDFDLELTGFSTEEIDRLLAKGSAGLTDPDETPEPPANPVAKLGDVWILGRHRLVCGDCTEVGIVDKALAGVKPHLMVTDPPYGVEYDPTWRDGVGAFGNTKMRGKVENDNRADWSAAWSLFPGDVAYIWHGALHAGLVAESLEKSGFQIRSQIIWTKQHFAMSRGDYHWMHEPCWYVVRRSATGHWAGDRKQTTVWPIESLNPSGRRGAKDGADSKLAHGTQKPVECMKRPIENNSSAGQAVYEPFSGSGTTIIAGEMTGRACHAIELNPAYIDVAVERWQNFTGEKAKRE